MDRRHLKILILAFMGLFPMGMISLRSQEPPGLRPPPERFVREPPLMGGVRRIDQLSPEDRQAFNRNFPTWMGLPPEQQIALRTLARARAQAEVDKALQDSGLRLDPDQREVFKLRYTQERRKLERELQQQIAQERARRMPEIIGRLRSEFGGAPVAAAAVTPAGKPAASPTAGAVRASNTTVLPALTPAPVPAH